MRTLILRHSPHRIMITGEAPVFNPPKPPAVIQTPDGDKYVSEDELHRQKVNAAILFGGGALVAGIMGTTIALKVG